MLSLVQDGRVNLTAPVGTYLSRWQLPDSDFDNNEVTIERLLSHTAGFTDGLGFGDYELDEPLPDLVAELTNPRGSSGESITIAVRVEPGTEFIYSGGGYLILQLLVEEVSGQTFADYVGERLFQPLGMERSTYEPLVKQSNISPSFGVDGSEAPTYQYASAAATGLSSTLADLSKLALAVFAGAESLPIDVGMLEAMREPHGFLMGAGIWGLGNILYAPTDSGDFVFGHDGGNDPAINSTVRLNPHSSDGLIVLVSGHPSLATRIGSEWVLWQTVKPDVLQTERALLSALVPFAVGGFLFVALFIFLVLRRSK